MTETPDPTATPTPTETLRERVRGALATVPLGEDDVHVFYVAEKHLDRLTDAVLAAVSTAAPDERELVRHLDRFIADCAAEGVEKGVLSVEWAGRLRAALAARPARGVSTADVDAREALRERIAAVVDAVTRLEVAMDAVLAVLGFTVADEGRAEA